MFTSEAAKSLYQSPQWGEIAASAAQLELERISIPAMGAIDAGTDSAAAERVSIPAMGGNS